MSKSSRAKARKEKRSEEQSKQQQTKMMAVGAIALVIIAAVAYFFIQNNQEMVVTERMLLDPVLGDPDAPILIEEYAAYSCSACKAVHEQGILEAILEQYPQVKIVFKDFPVIIPAYDRAAAEVTQCALDQGNEQFWILHDWLYTEAIQGRTSQNEIIQAASELGLDGDVLRECVQADTHQATVQYDLQRGLELGINGTPTFFVNGQRMFGFEQLVDTIEAEIARLGL